MPGCSIKIINAPVEKVGNNVVGVGDDGNRGNDRTWTAAKYPLP